MERVLITGGLGHIGSGLLKHLDFVTTPGSLIQYILCIVDDLSTQRYCSLSLIRKTKDKFIAAPFSKILTSDLKKFDTVVHLAATTDAAGSIGKPAEFEKKNLQEAIDFIDKCGEAGTRIIFPSSTSVYGVATDVVYEDDPKVINPQSPYAETKIAIEEYLRSSGVNYTIFRLGTICGTSIGMRFHTAINKFCYQARFGIPLTVWKDNVNMVRPYLCLQDACNVLQHAIDHPGRFDRETYNVVSYNIELQNIIDVISQYAEVEVEMVNTPLLNQFSYEVSCEKLLIRADVKLNSRTIDFEIRDTLQWLSNE